MSARPNCTVLAGPNGSGKSSLADALKPDGIFINADLIARGIDAFNPESVSLAAGRETLRALDAAILRHESFVYETTLSSHQSISVMEECREAGYRVELVFVMLETVELNLRRIAERVANGGHDIPETTVRRRHASAFRRLPTAIQLADTVLIFDNSGIEPQLLAAVEEGAVRSSRFDETNELHKTLAQIIRGE